MESRQPEGATPVRRELVTTQGLGKRFGDFVAVEELDLSIERGEIFALLGPNGAGKTTAIRMLMGLLQPSAGSGRIDGLDCFSERAEVKRRVGYLPDDPVFYDYLRGREIVTFVGQMHGLSRSAIEVGGERLMQRFGIADAAEEFAVNYSRGMKKRLALVCALLHDPPLLILDEPTSGLDPVATRALQEFLREEAEGGKTVFFSTHLLDQAERISHRVGILFKARLRAVGSLEELRSSLWPGGSLEEIFFAAVGEDPRELGGGEQKAPESGS